MSSLNWSTYLKFFLLAALVGFALVIISGFWHILTMLLFIAVAVSLWKGRRAFTK